MATVTLLHLEETLTIPTLQATTKFSLFQTNPTLLTSPYRLQSPVSLSIFRDFLSTLAGNPIKITDTNFTALHQLCKEFGSSELAAQLSDFLPSMDFKTTEDARGRITVFEEKIN
jgi:hypothetical protein